MKIAFSSLPSLSPISSIRPALYRFYFGRSMCVTEISQGFWNILASDLYAGLEVV
jgi:hypothetical protein